LAIRDSLALGRLESQAQLGQLRDVDADALGRRHEIAHEARNEDADVKPVAAFP
jgi:hypothetical protein